MAREGIRLTSFYAAPSCSPSRAALLTGRYPPRSGIHRVLGPDERGGIPASEITLAEALKSQGYRTAAIGKWHLGSSDEKFFPTKNGFDEYFGLLYSNDMTPPWVETDRPLKLYRNAQPVEHPVKQATLTERYTDEAVRFIKSSKGSPFFLYLAYTMPHVPLHASEKFLGSSRAGLFGDVVETIDWSAGRILDVLKEEGLDDTTLVVFTSDNGPWLDMPPRMFRGGEVKPQHAGSPGPLRGWKGSTYEGGVRVPCIFRWPGRIPPGRVSADIACTMDIFATLVKLSGAEVPADRVVDGLDILPLLSGTGPSPREEFCYYLGKSLEAVRRGKWKLRISNHLRQNIPEGQPLRPELYDLDVDPSERYDQSAGHPEIVTELKGLMERLSREMVFGTALAS
jgi:arylsulfatase A-like enzyme